MKAIFLFLFICLFAHGWAAPQNDSLPEVPWKTIAEMTVGKLTPRWGDDITVRLLGNYSKSDSLMVEQAISDLNELTETVNLTMTTRDKGALEIYFIDSTNVKYYSQLLDFRFADIVNWTYSYKNMTPDNDHPFIYHFSLALQLNQVPDSARQNFITNKMAIALFPHYLDTWRYRDGPNYNGPITIFGIYAPETFMPQFSPLNDFDKQIIKAIYAKNYEQLLPIANKQYGQFEFPSWVSQNSIAILAFPFVLVLFLMVGVFIWLYKKMFVHINNKWVRFNAISAMALTTFAVLMWLFDAFNFMLIESSWVFHSDLKNIQVISAYCLLF
jgi:hypothetical protein